MEYALETLPVLLKPLAYILENEEFISLELTMDLSHFKIELPLEALPGHDGIHEVDALLRENGIERDAGKKPYFCVDCGKPLSFPEAFFYLCKTYCSEHLPCYSRETEGW